MKTFSVRNLVYIARSTPLFVVRTGLACANGVHRVSGAASTQLAVVEKRMAEDLLILRSSLATNAASRLEKKSLKALAKAERADNNARFLKEKAQRLQEELKASREATPPTVVTPPPIPSAPAISEPGGLLAAAAV
jgi:hypothetical protein